MEKKFSGKSIEEAREEALRFFEERGVSELDVVINVIETPVKKLFGTKGEYVISAKADIDDDAGARLGAPERAEQAPSPQIPQGDYTKITTYLTNILEKLGAEDFHIDIIEKSDATILDIVGDKLGIAIGRRGETLDSLQYLAILANNRSNGGDTGKYKRISVDCNGYREKRKETLESLATRTANKVLKQGRRITLEPMNPYERRIIHSKAAEIEGVYSNSIGEEPFRKVVISANVPKPRDGYRDNRDGHNGYRDNRDGHNGYRDNRDGRGGRRDSKRDSSRDEVGPARSYKQSSGFSTSFEREYKRAETVEISQDTVDFEKNASVGKIEL